MIPRNKQVYIRKVPIKQVSGSVRRRLPSLYPVMRGVLLCVCLVSICRPLESRGTAPPEEAPTLTAKDLIDSKVVITVCVC